jgi:hypothetical protein
MAYNNIFPMGYQPAYYPQQQQQYQMQTPVQQPQQNSSIIWVQGEAGAKAVPVAPGQKALLMDSETNVFYVKSSDVSGMPLPLRIFEYKEVSKVATDEANAGPQNTYVTHEELERILADLKPKEQLKEKKEVKKNEFII